MVGETFKGLRGVALKFYNFGPEVSYQGGPEEYRADSWVIREVGVALKRGCF